MRIDQLTIKNFKKFADFTIDLHPQFTLLVGDNGTGKTTILDALAIAAGVWLVNIPDSILKNSRRNILTSEIRLEAIKNQTITQFIEHTPVQIEAKGEINGQSLKWLRQIKKSGSRTSTSNTEAKKALNLIQDIFNQVQAGEKIWLPIIAYYGAGRAWLPSNQRNPKAKTKMEISRRWDAFYDCFEERIRIGELHTWFHKEALSSLNNQGQMSSSYEVVKHAILGCIPDSENLWFDSKRAEIVIAIAGNSQPFSNLSAGQKMMVALIADIAIKIVTQNAAFLPKESTLKPEKLPEILEKTTGLVMIDELDVHLHPKWQRCIVNDLKNTFPSIQFVCTTHSPVILSEVEAKCIRFLEKEEESIEIFTPSDAFGLDVNRILNELMGVLERNQEINTQIHQMFQLIDDEEFDLARQKMIPLIEKIGENDPNITRAKSLIQFLEGDSEED